jgi:glucosylceramidase
MSVMHDLYPSADQVVSECSPGIIQDSVPEVVISSLRNWASVVALWNLALDPGGGPVQAPNIGCSGCTGLATINESDHTVSFGLPYYQLGQASKFVHLGAWRIGAEHFVSYFRNPLGLYGATPGLDDTAFLNPDGSRVVLAYNNGPAPIRFGVSWRRAAFAYTLAPGATVTFQWTPGR